MTNEEARLEVLADVPRGTADQLDHFVALLVEEAAHQNLIAPSTIPEIWRRHIMDSAQLVGLDIGLGPWWDIGTGAGLPGLVVALLTQRPITLVEPRSRRADFLARTVAKLGLSERVTVLACKVETITGSQADVISARAVANMTDLLSICARVAHAETRWILPRGRSAANDVAAARALWHGRFELVASRTDAESAIVVASELRPRGRR